MPQFHVLGLRLALPHPAIEQVVDPLDDRAVGPEILVQVHRRPVHLAPENVELPHVRPAKPVDRLLRVADDEQPAVRRRHLAPVRRTRLRRRALRYVLGEEHRNLHLYRVGVLHLIEQNVRITLPEVVPDVDIVPKQVPRPHQQVMVSGASFPLAVALILSYEVAQRAENREQRDVPGMFELQTYLIMDLSQVILEHLAGIHTRDRVRVPVALPSQVSTKRHDP